MKITLAKSIILDRDAVFAILEYHFRARGYDVANMSCECSSDILQEITLNITYEELKHEQNI